MPTRPDRVRRGLQLVTDAALADLRAVVAAAKGESPSTIRAAVFAAAPLLVDKYSDGSSALSLDWYEEIRDAARAPSQFTPSPLRSVTDEDVAAMVAEATKSLHDLELLVDAEAERLVAKATDTSLTLLEGGLQKQVADGFWTTTTGNVANDPDAVGWQRFARGAACKFCLMLAGRGAVYRKSIVNFAAHGGCHCVSGPSFDPNAPRADVMQYVAAKRQRTAKERADLREYLNHNFPDAPG
jgi:hypothetical protein